jgi:hypothetical protein
MRKRSFNRNPNQRQVLPRPGSEREESLSGIPSDILPSEAKVETETLLLSVGGIHVKIFLYKKFSD